MRLLAALAAAVLIGGCGSGSDGQRHCNDGSSDNSLNGSYCEDIDMAFTEVKCLLVGSTLRIEYLRPAGTTNEKTLQIIIGSSVVVLEPNVEISMVQAGAEVRRITTEAQVPQNLSAEMEDTSRIFFSEYNGMIGSHADGEFGMLFKSGRTLSGEFDCTIEDARPAGT